MTYEVNERVLTKFREDTKNHIMKIEMDQGVHRSILFSNGTSVYHYRINTWHNHLCISGDMGTFVFERLPDMFEFFNQSRINPSYWREKLVAGEAEEFQGWDDSLEDLFKSKVISKSELKKLKEISVENEYEACQALSENIVDGWELSSWTRRYTFHYLWCLWAIVDSVKKYNEHKTNLAGGHSEPGVS